MADNLAAILGIGYLFMHSPSSPEKVTVASVRGMTYEQAAKTLSPDFTVTKREVADNAAENTVIDQDPAGGTEASRRSDVTLTVSTGPDSVKVPNVVGDAVNETVVYSFMALFVVNVVVTAVGLKATAG